jgi:hypothetical protein
MQAAADGSAKAVFVQAPHPAMCATHVHEPKYVTAKTGSRFRYISRERRQREVMNL